MSNITDVSDQSPQSQRSQHPLVNIALISELLVLIRIIYTGLYIISIYSSM